ncbi:MAG: MIP/aquaporin family protein [Chlamydiia bacterium]
MAKISPRNLIIKSFPSYVAEFIGTFFLVLTVGLAAIAPSVGMLAPLAIGSVLMVMIYATSHISGGHLNPAVTIGIWLRGGLDRLYVIPYIVAQLLGSVVAAYVSMAVKGPGAMPMPVSQVLPVFVLELLFTFALVYVVLNVATSKKTADNSFYGLAIGFTVIVGACVAGPISGGVFNPAIALGNVLTGITSLADVGIFVAAQIVAALVAVGAFRYQHPTE